MRNNSQKNNPTPNQENLWCKLWEKLQNISGSTRCSSVSINTCHTDFSRLGLRFHSLNEWWVYLSGLLTWQIKNLNHTTVVRTLLINPDKDCKWLQLSFSTQRNRLLSNFHLQCIFPKQLSLLLQLISLIRTFESVYPVNWHHWLILLLRNSNAIIVS